MCVCAYAVDHIHQLKGTTRGHGGHIGSFPLTLFLLTMYHSTAIVQQLPQEDQSMLYVAKFWNFNSAFVGPHRNFVGHGLSSIITNFLSFWLFC